jgi:RNA polymerase-associated protein RTF1
VGNTKTDKVLLLKTPGEEKGKKFRFEYISNQGFTQQEFDYWKKRMEANQVAFPTLDDVAKKEKEVKEAMDYQLQEDDVTAVRNYFKCCKALFIIFFDQ